MAVNKVKFGGNTLIDLTGDTLDSAEQLLKGIIAHAKDGSVITGQMEAGGGGANNVSYGTYTAFGEYSHKVEHALGTTPAALLFVYAGTTEDISAKYDEAPIAHIIPNKNSTSYRWMFYRSKFQSAILSASATSKLWSTGTTNANYDRVNNINDQYFCTPINCNTGTYFWAVFKEALI